MAATVNWAAAVFTHFVGTWIIQLGVGILLVIAGVVALRKERQTD